MAGLSLEVRYQLVREAERRAIAAEGITPADARVLRSLCFDFHSGRTGRCDPGYRAIARRARCAVSTVWSAIRRLAAAGFLAWERRLIRVGGRWLRWTHSYTLGTVATLISGVSAEPVKVSKKAQERPRSVAAQLAAIARWAADWERQRAVR